MRADDDDDDDDYHRLPASNAVIQRLANQNHYPAASDTNSTRRYKSCGKTT